MNIKILNIFSLSLVCYSFLGAQCYFSNTVFRVGERIEYNIKYNIGFIWIDAGFANFSIDSVSLNGSPAYRFVSKGSSYEKYDWIYKVRESYEAYCTYSPMKPLSYKRNSIEGNYFAIEEYFFNYEQQKTYTKVHNSKKSLTYDTLPLINCGYDLLTAIYAFRNINFEELKDNEKIYINVLIDNKWERQYIRMMGKKNFNSNNKLIPCYHLKASMLEGTIFKGGENTDIWITQSKERIPIYIEAKILVGTVKVFLSNYKKE